jgi:hypothetical protein
VAQVQVGAKATTTHVAHSVRKITALRVAEEGCPLELMNVVVDIKGTQDGSKPMKQENLWVTLLLVASQGIVLWEFLFITHMHNVGLGMGLVPCFMERNMAIAGYFLYLCTINVARTLRLHHPWVGIVAWSECSRLLRQLVWARPMFIVLRVFMGIVMSHARIQAVWRYVVPVSVYSSMWATRYAVSSSNTILGVIERWVVFGYTQNTIGTHCVWAADVCWTLARCFGFLQQRPGRVARCAIAVYVGILVAEVVEVCVMGAPLGYLELFFALLGTLVVVCVAAWC